MKLILTATEAALLIDMIQSLQSVKPEAPKVSSWEPNVGEEILVSDDRESWELRIFKRFNKDGKPVAWGGRSGLTLSWEYMMPFDKTSIQ